MEPNKTGERLSKVIELLHMEQVTFASAIGVHRSSVYKIADGTQKLSPSMVRRITTVFPNVNANFLMTGNGNPFIEDVTYDIIKDFVKAKGLSVSEIAHDTGLTETDVMELLYSAKGKNMEHVQRVMTFYDITKKADPIDQEPYIKRLEEKCDLLNQEIGRLKAILSANNLSADTIATHV